MINKIQSFKSKILALILPDPKLRSMANPVLNFNLWGAMTNLKMWLKFQNPIISLILRTLGLFLKTLRRFQSIALALKLKKAGRNKKNKQT
jgi:hypothetical protein